LRVLGLYDNDDWLKMDGSVGEWAVAFHGTSGSGEAGLTSITTTRFFAVGSAHACARSISKAPLTMNQAYGGRAEQAIYFTKGVDHCFKLQTKGYEIAFQCRVNPAFVYDSDPTSPSVYCIVRKPENIRPYGLLFRKM